MKQNKLRRIVAGASALTMAAGMAATIGMGAANAAPDTVEWTEKDTVLGVPYNYSLARTISNTTPSPGDTITVETRFSNPPVDWYIETVKDIHNTCLTYVPGSATFNGTPANNVDPKNPDPAYPDVAYVSAKPDTSKFNNRVGGKSMAGKTFKAEYTVGENCARDTDLQSTVHFGTSTIDREPTNKGPAIRVAKTVSLTTLELAPAPQAGTESTLTATVAPATATGDVEFFDGATSLGTTAIISGTASIAWTPSTAGADYSITAKYLGDAKTNESTSAAQTGTVSAPAVDQGDENPGDETPGDDDAGSLGSLGSLSSIFGSLG